MLHMYFDRQIGGKPAQRIASSCGVKKGEPMRKSLWTLVAVFAATLTVDAGAAFATSRRTSSQRLAASTTVHSS